MEDAKLACQSGYGQIEITARSRASSSWPIKRQSRDLEVAVVLHDVMGSMWTKWPVEGE